MNTEGNLHLTEEIATETPLTETVSATNDSQEEPLVEEINYKNWSKEALLKAFQEAKALPIMKGYKLANKLRLAIEEKIQEEKEFALEKFIAEGGEEDDFEYKGAQQLAELEKELRNLKNKQKEYLNDLNRKKQEHYQTRLKLLEKLRFLVDGQKEMTYKQIQDEWKSASPVPQEHNTELWSSFHALSDRYYNNRNIDFELKQLDRKKNLETKLELCQKAETLLQEPSINKSLEILNFLHREYKHTGPVADEQKEAVWQRFKLASDAIYLRRDAFLQEKQAEHKRNLAKKKEFLSKLEPFSNFSSDSTDEWKNKVTEFEALKKEWVAIGFSGKEQEAKEIGKKYWDITKTFFKHKNEHYKKVFDILQTNLKNKESLIAQAEGLANEQELEKAIKTVLELQKKWKEAGHVPFKLRDKIYERFKKACDTVFERKRGIEKEKEGEYENNLGLKQAICKQINSLDTTLPESFQVFKQLLTDWKKIGFVPKKDVAKLQTEYSAAVKAFIDNSKQNEDEKRKIKVSLELEEIKSKPDAKLLLQKKEHFLKGKIKTLQSEIDTLRNNLLFFARSKNADSLAKDVETKVQAIEKQIKNWNEELQLIKSF
jgi:hypothetical protein